MNKIGPHLIIFFLLPFLLGFTSKPQRPGLWERHCAACHDGKTELNMKVVIDKDQIKAKYETIADLVKAVTCEGPPCMNILKHDEALIIKVGKEIGIKKDKPKMLEVMSDMFAQKKAKKIEDINESIRILERRKKCIEAAQDSLSLENCK